MRSPLSSKQAVLLELLGAGERYGLELVDRSGGAVKRGTVYVTLARMEDAGLVASRQEEQPPPGGGLPRRLYRPTAFGERLLEVHRAWAAAVALRPVEEPT